MLKDIIKIARLKKGLSQDDLAEKLYITRSSISKYEKGLALPQADRLNELAVVLDIDRDLLLRSMNEEVDDINKEEKMSKLNERFISIKDSEKAKVFINDLLRDFKFDKNFEETLKNWTYNYVYMIMLFTMNIGNKYGNKDSGYYDEDFEYDIYNYVCDLTDFAINGLFPKELQDIGYKNFEFEANELESVIANIYDVYNSIIPTEGGMYKQFQATLLNFSNYIKKASENHDALKDDYYIE